MTIRYASDNLLSRYRIGRVILPPSFCWVSRNLPGEIDPIYSKDERSRSVTEPSKTPAKGSARSAASGPSNEQGTTSSDDRIWPRGGTKPIQSVSASAATTKSILLAKGGSRRNTASLCKHCCPKKTPRSECRWGKCWNCGFYGMLRSE